MRLSRLARIWVLLLISTLVSNDIAFAARKPLDASAVKAKIASRGLGQNVKVTKLDKTQIAGTIIGIGEQSFALRAKAGAQPEEVPYTEVSEVHNSGHLSTGAKIGIGVGIAAAVIGIVALVFIHNFRSGFPKTI
jgi:hypothetical protein